jgi:transposase
MKKNPSRINPSHPLSTINPDAAGIDIGSEEIYACVPSDRNPDFVRSFDTFTADLYALASWLKTARIKTVAMEATGIYWIPLYEILEAQGFQVHLVNPKQLKRSKKTDVLDCQWLQQMHSYGLLNSSFRPPDEICALRALVRHRDNLIRYRSAHVQHIQKALHQMNIQLDNVLGDITGVTGLQILQAIADGNTDPQHLAQFRDYRCRSSKETIRKSLEGNYRKEHIFQLKQSLEFFHFYNRQLQTCELEIQQSYEKIAQKRGIQKPVPEKSKPIKHKNQPSYDLQPYLFRCAGVDLTRITGLSTLTVQTIFSEIGFDLTRFPTVKHFTSWLNLCPNNKISGGKILQNKTKELKNRAGQSFRIAACSVARSASPLGAYYRRIRAIHGPAKANVATAHKLARIFYFMVKNQIEFNETLQEMYDQRYHQRQINNLKRKATQFGFELVPLPVS